MAAHINHILDKAPVGQEIKRQTELNINCYEVVRIPAHTQLLHKL